MSKTAIFIMAFMGYLLVTSAFRNYKDPITRRVLKGIHWNDFAWSILCILAVIATAYALSMIHPLMSWSWWQYIGGGNGSVISGQTPEAGRAILPSVIAVCFPVLILINIPAFAYIEERMFRKGAERRGRAANAMYAIWFGLVHMIMGVPLFAALAISVAGLFFTHRYLSSHAASGDIETALIAAASRHAAYNLILVSLLLLAALVLLAGAILL